MNQSAKRIVIVGATSLIAEHCARLWVRSGAAEIILIGRDAAKTGLIAQDLAVRSPGTACQAASVDFSSPSALSELADQLFAAGPVDIVLIAHGSLPDQQACQVQAELCQEAILVNAVSPVLFAEMFAGHMERQGHGCIAVIGSVAGDRGRKSNYVYGAAKGMVERYVQGLQHRLAGKGVLAVIIKPGPVDTPMTAALKQKGARLASPESVAADIVGGIEKGKTMIYTPGKWRLIMTVIRYMPSFIFNKLDI